MQVKGSRVKDFLSLICLMPLMFSGCTSMQTAQIAKTSLLGMSELDLEACLGLPDQKITKGKTTLFTYTATAGRTLNLTVPIVNGIGMSFGGYCHATFRLEDGRVTDINYSGDTTTFEGEDSVCAPIVRSCVEKHGHR